MFGRKRYFGAIRSHILYIRAAAEREATNAPLQGTAADIIKLAIRYVDERLQKENLKDKVHLILQIHDELIYEVKDDVLEQVEILVETEMTNVFKRSFLNLDPEVPLVVKREVGKNWGDMS